MQSVMFRLRTGSLESPGVSFMLDPNARLALDAEQAGQPGSRVIVATITLEEILVRAVRLLVTLIGDVEGQVLLEMGESLDIWCDGQVVATITPMLQCEGG